MANFFESAGRSNLGSQLNSLSSTLISLRNQKLNELKANLDSTKATQSLQLNDIKLQKQKNELMLQQQKIAADNRVLPIDLLTQNMGPNLKQKVMDFAVKGGFVDVETGTIKVREAKALAEVIGSNTTLFKNIAQSHVNDIKSQLTQVADKIAKIEKQYHDNPKEGKSLKDNKEYQVLLQDKTTLEKQLVSVTTDIGAHLKQLELAQKSKKAPELSVFEKKFKSITKTLIDSGVDPKEASLMALNRISPKPIDRNLQTLINAVVKESSGLEGSSDLVNKVFDIIRVFEEATKNKKADILNLGLKPATIDVNTNDLSSLNLGHPINTSR